MGVPLDKELAKFIGENKVEAFGDKIGDIVLFMKRMCKEIADSKATDSEINALLYQTVECTISALVNFLMPSHLHREFYEKLYKETVKNSEIFEIAEKLAKRKN